MKINKTIIIISSVVFLSMSDIGKDSNIALGPIVISTEKIVKPIKKMYKDIFKNKKIKKIMKDIKRKK